MSVPAFAWAMQRGRQLNLPTAERMLLIAIADRANGTRACYAGQECLAEDTGLASRWVRVIARKLEQLGLIRMERRGKAIHYHVLRPVVAEASSGERPQTPEPSSAKTPEPSSGKHRKSVPVRRANTGTQRQKYRKPVPVIPEPSSDKPESNQEREPEEARARAAAAASSPPLPGGRVAAASSPEPPDDFNAWLDGKAALAMEAEEVTEDDVPRTDGDRDRMARAGEATSEAVLAALKPRKPPKPLSRDAQLAALEASHTPEEMERAARAFALRARGGAPRVAAG